MATFDDNPDAATAQVARDIAGARERAERAVEVKASLDRVRGKARSRQDEVDVEVDVSGQVTGLRLDDSAMEMHPDDLAALIRETIRAAVQVAGRAAVAVTDDAYGEGSAVSKHLAAELDTRRSLLG